MSLYPLCVQRRPVQIPHTLPSPRHPPDDVLLAPYVAAPGISLLEVGVKKGGSLKMWRELLHAESRVFGADIDPGIPAFPLDASVKTIVADSTVLGGDIVRALRGVKLDVIIDDGHHEELHQLRTLRNLLPFLTPTGVYVIEDLLSFWGLQDALARDFPRLRWVRLADTEESLLVIYPEQSLAPVALGVGHVISQCLAGPCFHQGSSNE